MTVQTMRRLLIATFLAASALQAGGVAHGAGVPSSNPFSGDPQAIANGRALYGEWCAPCHGPKANGVSKFGAYAGDLRKFWRGYTEFLVITANGRPKKQMPPWKGVLADHQISEIGAYLETLAVEGAK